MDTTIQILIAPNAFKGSLSSLKVANAIKIGLEQRFQNIDIFPIADGGDDTLDVFLNAFSGEKIAEVVSDPLGRKIEAHWGITQSETAIIEMAEASGIRYLKNSELDPFKASSFGTGELIQSAIDKGTKKMLIGIGGSATVDGGTGILKALGAKFFRDDGSEINHGNFIVDLHSLELNDVKEKLNGVEIIVLNDVDNPLLGENGAARVFGPQKGANDQDVEGLENYMRKYSQLMIDMCGNDFSDFTGSGAAGGIGYMLKSLFGAKMEGGFDYLLKNSRLEKLIESCDVIITGEGKIDSQTLQGKGPGRIAKLAKANGKTCIGVCGTFEPHAELEKYFDQIIPLVDEKTSEEQAMKKTFEVLKSAGGKISKIIAPKPL